MSAVILLRGGGDLASGVAVRLARAGLSVLITELPAPLAVRRLVSFSQAVYDGEITIEGIHARRASGVEEAHQVLSSGEVAVLVDPASECRHALPPLVVIDGRMTKKTPETFPEWTRLPDLPLMIGLGPGFEAGVHCHAVVETLRGPDLGRVYWQGAASPDTGMPETVAGWQAERVLRAPAAGRLFVYAAVGDLVTAGQLIAAVNGQALSAPFAGCLRGLLSDGAAVTLGMKIGDLDPRLDARLAHLVSDKSLAVGGGVLEAILSVPRLRPILWA